MGWAPRGQGGCVCQGSSCEPDPELRKRKKVAGRGLGVGDVQPLRQCNVMARREISVSR